MTPLLGALLFGAPAAADDEAAEALPGQCSPDDPHYDLEVLYFEGEFQRGLAECESRIAASPDKDLYWLKARFMYELGERIERTDTSVDKQAFYNEMLATAEKGLELAPGDLHLRFARGVAMGRLGTTRGVLSSLFMAKDVESDWLAVANAPTWRYSSIGGIEMLPCDAYHALGIYYRLVPEWWIVQVLAGTRGDLDKSLEFNLKSIQCKPHEVQNWKELAATQLCIATKRNDDALLAEGKRSADKAASLKAVSDKQRMDQKHALAMRDDPSLACGYSRDGQQDLDEKRLKK
jgi:hypothetical protein